MMENLPKYWFHSENMGVDAKELGDLCINPYYRAQGNMFEWHFMEKKIKKRIGLVK